MYFDSTEKRTLKDSMIWGFLAETQPLNLFKCNSLYPKYKRRIGACQIQAIYETY